MNRRLLVIVIVLAAIVGGGYAFVKRRAATAVTGETQYKVSKVETGEVKKTVSSSGILQPWNIIDIKARAGGELRDLRVDVGDEVKKGQLLARIDPLDVRLALSTARADEQSARAREAQTGKTYELQVKQSRISIQDARVALQSSKANAQAARARLSTGQTQSTAQPALTKAAIQSAQASYDQAVQQRDQLLSTNKSDKAAAKAAYDQAIANQTNARLAVSRQRSLEDKGFVAQQSVDTAQANATVTEAQVTSAKARLDNIDAQLAAGLEGAEARIAQSKATLSQAKTNSIDITSRKNSVQELQAAVNQADAAVARAEVALNQAITNQANNEIRRYDVAQAASSIARAEASRINAETSMERTDITAPSDGIVLQKYVEQGTIIASALSITASGTSILQIGDVARMYVDVNVDETDIANVDVGQKVDVEIEAYPGVPFEGKVIRIDPRAQVEQNVTSIHVRVEVDNSAATFRLLKPGMNATCQFVIAREENTVAVPNEAIREDDKGKYVEIASGGTKAPPDPKTGEAADEGALIGVKIDHRSVELGIEGNDTTQIVSGLKAGETIVTQTIEPEVAAPAAGAFGGGGIGGRPGGGGGGGGRGR